LEGKTAGDLKAAGLAAWPLAWWSDYPRSGLRIERLARRYTRRGSGNRTGSIARRGQYSTQLVWMQALYADKVLRTFPKSCKMAFGRAAATFVEGCMRW